jgi:hypothetical protein
VYEGNFKRELENYSTLEAVMNSKEFEILRSLKESFLNQFLEAERTMFLNFGAFLEYVSLRNSYEFKIMNESLISYVCGMVWLGPGPNAGAPPENLVEELLVLSNKYECKRKGDKYPYIGEDGKKSLLLDISIAYGCGWRRNLQGESGWEQVWPGARREIWSCMSESISWSRQWLYGLLFQGMQYKFRNNETHKEESNFATERLTNWYILANCPCGRERCREHHTLASWHPEKCTLSDHIIQSVKGAHSKSGKRYSARNTSKEVPAKKPEILTNDFKSNMYFWHLRESGLTLFDTSSHKEVTIWPRGASIAFGECPYCINARKSTDKPVHPVALSHTIYRARCPVANRQKGSEEPPFEKTYNPLDTGVRKREDGIIVEGGDTPFFVNTEWYLCTNCATHFVPAESRHLTRSLYTTADARQKFQRICCPACRTEWDVLDILPLAFYCMNHKPIDLRFFRLGKKPDTIKHYLDSLEDKLQCAEDGCEIVLTKDEQSEQIIEILETCPACGNPLPNNRLAAATMKVVKRETYTQFDTNQTHRKCPGCLESTKLSQRPTNMWVYNLDRKPLDLNSKELMFDENDREFHRMTQGREEL